MEKKIWAVKDSPSWEQVNHLSHEVKIGPILSYILCTRGYSQTKSAFDFLQKNNEILHDPFLLNDMEQGVARILKAVKEKEKIVIYGDYDVDGITSVSILHLYLESIGAQVEYYIPSRKTEGYGVNKDAITRLAQNGMKLMITVDTGITAMESIEHAYTLGVDVVVTDHHECQATIPTCEAVINPKRLDTTYPFSMLAGVGVVFKVLCALEARFTGKTLVEAVSNIAYRYADLVAIGTVADVMPICDENRIIVAYGISLMEKTDKFGVEALLSLCRNNDSKTQKKISTGLISFNLAPRVNAAGRVADASISVELFLSKDKKTAELYAQQLAELNKERQLAENDIAEEAYAMLDSSEKSNVIILDNEKWNHGIIGIVSSRITEKYNVPSILISFEGNEDPFSPDAVGKGSGRSIPGMNLVNALGSCTDLLDRFGGHELAAGLSIRRKNLPEFIRRMNEYASGCFMGEMPLPTLNIDMVIEPKDVSAGAVKELSLLEPYGVSNQMPVFAMYDMILEDASPVASNKHLRLRFSKDGNVYNGIYFNVSPEDFAYSVGERVDVAFNLDINEFLGVSKVQFNVKDIRPSGEMLKEQTENEELFASVKEGNASLPLADVLPTREDFATVYAILQKSAREGRNRYQYMTLLRECKEKDEKMNYVKTKVVCKVFLELNLLTIKELSETEFSFAFPSGISKTNLEKSSILKKLKSMYPF